MKQAYLAGDGLKKGNQMLRKVERDAIHDLGAVHLYNPWDQKDINDKKNNPTAEMIFDKDTRAILSSEIIIADVDNNSVGTTSEMGQIWGINYMHDEITAALAHAESDQQFREIMEGLVTLIPRKKVYWQTTDIRDTNIFEYGNRRSHSLNQYLHGMMLHMSGDSLPFPEILVELKKQAGDTDGDL